MRTIGVWEIHFKEFDRRVMIVLVTELRVYFLDEDNIILRSHYFRDEWGI